MGLLVQPPDLVVYPYPWEASICQLCQSWFTRAVDFRAHHDSQHSNKAVHYRCTKCQSNHRRWNGVAVHYARCRGPPTPTAPGPEHICVCGRSFSRPSGLALQRNTCQPYARNAERLVPPPPPLLIRSSTLWSPEEDDILRRRYWEYTANGRRQGYAQFIAVELPRKTERQVRDRTHSLRARGLLERPRPDPEKHVEEEPQEELPVEEEVVEEDQVEEEEEIAEEDPRTDVEQQPNNDFQPGHDAQPEDDDQPEDDIPDEDNTNEDTPVQRQPEVDQPEEMERRTPEAPGGRIDQNPVPIVLGLDVSPEAPEAVIPPPSLEPEQTVPTSSESERWTEVLDNLNGIQLLDPIGLRLRQLAEREGDIQGELDALVKELHAAMKAAAPVPAGRPANVRGTRPSRTERTRRNVTRYAKTQDLWKKNPSRLADLVIKNNLGDLAQQGPRIDPPKEETVALFKGLWGTACDSTLPLPHLDPQPDAIVEPISSIEVTKRIRRLKPGGARDWTV
ncbi:uncharacterized protein LOC128998887 [Macrosteles quadrilineatus]|uniref:uncharacterized protein LOC128998887 n=1 Tax=Macrosteles quadrilineatus TaxID=74068 RepID=UPI0023E193F5|nr:uncharacterized protein LOC128998887 [Macrosteles quadrilineatus]